MMELLCWEIGPDEEVGCVQCIKERDPEANYRRNEAVLVDMLSSPYGDGQAHYMCNRHLEYFFGRGGIERVDPLSFED